jgi:hypothetical protein
MKSEIKQLKKIKVLSFAKFFAILGIVMGLVFGIISAVQSHYNPITISEATQYIQNSPENIVSIFFLALGLWSVIVAPILFGFFQFIYGAIIALIYNLIARFIGGIKIELI